ncbi:hypothetical protein PUW24_09780 [Paenibacillus urinalis]|uniref:Uncharacterized protein n=1 Tax=Paenibacillus urinalis TaxID=521520 RepID=A0ABY7XAL7_9BACL|nr:MULTISPECIES: hypothetical protein [Paenibacillus]WDH99137.1 hypothetical protein PUW24_09780 [Paenibacillus urinalis]WDI02827.1 hypothetical protein PUW25_02225 [Paenibacillus urinalis]GAK40325.1 hypothetical protein TCA2_2815 [Paenibacillus sp. TCA20]
MKKSSISSKNRNNNGNNSEEAAARKIEYLALIAAILAFIAAGIGLYIALKDFSLPDVTEVIT